MVGSSATYSTESTHEYHQYRVAIPDYAKFVKTPGTFSVKGQLFSNRFRDGEKTNVTFYTSQIRSSYAICQAVLGRCTELRGIVRRFNQNKARILQIAVISPDMVRVKRVSSWLEKMIGREVRHEEWVTVQEDLGEKFQVFIDHDGHGNKPVKKGLDVLEELVHFSYIDSNGESVICGLQGVTDGDKVRLAVPTIHSKTRRYGETDGGESGFLKVWKNHKCTDICRDWPRPSTSGCIDKRQVPSAPPPPYFPSDHETQLYHHTTDYRVYDNMDKSVFPTNDFNGRHWRCYEWFAHTCLSYDGPPPPYRETV